VFASLNCWQKDKEKKMISKHYRSVIAASVTILVWGFVATGATGQESPEFGPDKQPCNGIFHFKEKVTVDGKEWDLEGTHWEVGQRIRIIGPLGPNGDLIVTTLPSTTTHETWPGPYFATNVSGTTPPSIFQITTRVKTVKSNKHLEVTKHPQTMVVDDFKENVCPQVVVFHAEYDPEHEVDDHGGHAGASNF
jgi:hypothetical protein